MIKFGVLRSKFVTSLAFESQILVNKVKFIKIFVFNVKILVIRAKTCSKNLVKGQTFSKFWFFYCQDFGFEGQILILEFKQFQI